jgi:uncharacterized delta-60 repeat protein
MQSYIGDRNEVPYGFASAILPSGRKIMAIARGSAKNGNGLIVFTSMDGITWDSTGTIMPGIAFAGITVHPTTGVIVAVNQTASTNIISYVSSDFGATWTTNTTPRGTLTTYTTFNTMAYDKFNNRILMSNKTVSSASTAYSPIIQSNDNGVTWTSAYDKPNNGSTVTVNLATTDGGPYSVIGRVTNSNTALSEVIVIESASPTFRSTVNPTNMTSYMPTQSICGMSYNPLSNIYLQAVVWGVNSTQLGAIDPATMAFTNVPLPGMQTNEVTGAAVYSASAQSYIGSTRSSLGVGQIIIPQDRQRIIRSKYGNGGWLADPAPLFNTSNVEIWMMLDDPDNKMVYTYNAGNIYTGNDIGYIGVTTNLPTPTPTISQSSTPVALDDFDVLGGGSFTSVNNMNAINRYALLSNNGVDVKSQPIVFSAGSQVTCVLPVAGTNDVIIFGNFTTINGKPATSVARIDKSGTINVEFNFTVTGSVGNVLSAIIGGDGNVYMTSATGRVIKMALNGTVDSTWGNTLNISGNPVIHYDSRLDRYYITTDTRIVRAMPDGTVDSAFTQTSVAGATRAIRTQPDGKVLLYGAFNGIGGSGMQYLARLNENGTRDTTFYYNLNAAPLTIGGNQMVVVDTGFIIVGSFSAIEGTTRNYIAKINFDGRIDPNFIPVVNSSVYSIVLTSDKKLLITGAFTTVNGTNRAGTARLNQDGTLDTTYTSNFLPANNAYILKSMGQPQYSLTPTPTPSITPTPSQVPLSVVPIAIGSQNLLNINGITTSVTVGVLSNNGTSMVSDYTVAPVTGGAIHGICYTTDGTGDFFAYGSVPVNQDGHASPASMVRLTSNAGFVASFTSPATTTTSIIVPFTDGSYLFGDSDGKIKKMDGNGVVDTAWGSTLPATVPYPMIAYDSVRGKVYSLGSTYTLLCANEDGTLDTTYTRTSIGTVSVYGMAVQPDGKLVICTSGSSNNFRRFTTTGITDPTWNVNSNGSANVSYGGNCLAITKDGIYIAGAFTAINGVTVNGFARLLLSTGAVDPSFLTMTAVTGSFYGVSVGSDARPLVFGTFTRIRGVNMTNIARLMFDGSLDTSFTGITRNPVSGSIYVAKPAPVV